MKFSSNPKIKSVQEVFYNSFKSMLEGEELQNFSKNVLEYLKTRDPNKPIWGENFLGRTVGLVVEAALEKGGLLILILKNLKAVINIIGLFIWNNKEFMEGMSDKAFQESLYKDEQVKEFIKTFSPEGELSEAQGIEKIQNLVNILGAIPEKDPNSLLDREFIKAIFDVIQANKDKLDFESTKEIVQLAITGQFIPSGNTEAKRKNTLALAKAGIKLMKDFDALGNPILLKKSQISKLIVSAISQNAPGIIKDDAFEKLLEKIATERGMEFVLAKAEEMIDALEKQQSVVAHVIDILGGELYEGVREVIQDPNLIISQIVEIKSQHYNGKVVYKLSPLGEILISKGLISGPMSGLDSESIKNWSVTIDGIPEFDSSSKNDTFKGVKITKETFERQVINGFDVTALRGISQGLFAQQQTIAQIGHVIDDFEKGMPIFTILSNALKLIEKNPSLGAKLSEHRDILTELAINLTPAETLANFGLQPSFLEFIKPALKDEATIASLEKIITHLASDNSTQMTEEAVKLLQTNREIVEFLIKPEMQEQLAALVGKLSKSIDMMKEYLGRTEFIPLGGELEVSLKALLDKTLKLATGNGLLEELDLNMRCGQLVNGFMFGERVSNVQDRVQAEAAAKELYLILTANKGELPVALTGHQLAKLAPLGIQSLDQLNEELREGQINMAGYELYNQVNFVFKADFPPEQIATKQDLIQKLNTEKALAFQIISAGGDINTAIDAAAIEPGRASVLKGIFKTYNDKVTGFAEGQEKLCARFKHEIQMRKLEAALMACNSEAVFSLVKCDLPAGDITEEQLKELIRSNSFLPEGIATILIAGQASVATETLKSQLSDIACRKKGGEGVGDIQVMLGDVLSPFSSILQMPYSVSGDILDGLKDQLGDGELFTRDQVKAFLNEKLGNPQDIEIIISQLIIGESASRDVLLSNIASIAEEQKQAEKDKVDVIPALNKLLERIPQNPEMLRAVKRVITEKGTPESQSDVIIEALGEIFTTDLYSAEEKELLANKVIKPILRQMQMPTAVVNSIETVVNQALVSKESAKGLYNNPQIKDILKKILTQEFGSLISSNLTSSISALWNLGVSNSLSIGSQFVWNVQVENDPFVVAKFKAHLDIAKTNSGEGQKVKVQSLLRRYFRKNGLYTFSGQDLSGVDFSQTIISSAVFEQTTFGSAQFADAEFIKCDFNRCTIPQDLQLAGSKFDLKSFQSFIATAEANKLDINKLLAGVTVVSNGVPQGMDARLVYGLIQYCKANKVLFSQNVLIDAVKSERKFEEFYLFCGEGLQAMQKSIGGVSVLTLYETGKFDGLDAEQANEVIRLLKASGSVSMEQLDGLLAFLGSEQYASIKAIATALSVDDKTRIAIYAELKDSNLAEIMPVLGGFNPSANLQEMKDASVTALLKQWYLNRASGRMIPEASRNIDANTESLIRKAGGLKEDAVVDNVTKAIASKLLNDRFLKHPDRMHDLERIHAAVTELVADLSPEYKVKLGESDMSKLANDAYALIYPHTKYEKLSAGKLYIESTVTVEQIKGWLSSRFTEEVVAVNEIIQRAPSLEQYKAKLLDMPLDSLKIILTNPQRFAERSAVDVVTGMLYNGQDARIHDQMYALDADSLNRLLTADDEIFAAIKDYSKKSDIPLSEMVKHIGVLNNLKLLSDELVERYALVGDTRSEKLCLNLAAKLYTDSAEVKTLIGDENGREILANVFFVELQKLSKEIPPVDLTKLDDCSARLCAKLGAAHTPELVGQSMAQGRTIAEGIFEKLGIAAVWQDEEKTERSISNIAANLGAKIFESGKLIDEGRLASIIGEKRPAVGMGLFTGDQSTGMVKAYQSIYYSRVSGWYEVGKFDTKDNHTMRLLESFDSLISGQSRAL